MILGLDIILNLEYIESSKVSKIYPNTILIEVVENKPLLYFKQNKDLVIIDEKNNFLTVNNKVKKFYKIPIVIISNQSVKNIELNLYSEIIDMIKYSKKHFNSLYSDLNTINILDNSYILLYANKTKIYLSKNNAKNQIKYLSIFKDTIKNHRTLLNYLYIDCQFQYNIDLYHLYPNHTMHLYIICYYLNDYTLLHNLYPLE